MRHTAAFLLISGVFLGCASTEKAAPSREFLRFGAYEVLPPEGPGWTARVDFDQGEVLFLNRKDPPWHGAGFTMIHVYPVRTSEPFDPVAIVRKTFDREVDELTGKGVREGRFRLTDVRKEVVSIGEKTLHRMSFRVLQEALHPEGEAWLARFERYLFFPPDFPGTGVFYGFAIADLHVVGVLGERGSLSSIRPVIESFRTRKPAPPPEPPEPPPIP